MYHSPPQSGSQALDDVVVAQLETINFEALRDGVELERQKLLQACCRDGFFYLDMWGTHRDIHRAIADIYALETDIFALSEDELMQYDIDRLSPKKLNGYKPVGRNHGELSGHRDGFQSYAISKDGVMNSTSQAEFRKPKVVDKYIPSLHTFISGTLRAASIILTSLSSVLEIDPEESLQSFHRSRCSSSDLIRLLKYRPQPFSERGSSHVPHTDLGSLTFLFTRQYGLQVLDSQYQDWKWVEPREGYATVNLGDCLSLLTNTKLRSCRHRVRPLPGEAMKERYSFAYFMRPEDTTPMKLLKSPLLPAEGKEESEVITSAEWMRKKYAMLRKDTWTQEQGWILTGV